VAAVVSAIAVFFGVSRADLGVDGGPRDFRRDIKIGLVTGLAAIAPAYLMLGLLTQSQDPSKHPMIKMVMGSHQSLGVFIAAAILAMIVAPVCEEIVFRLLLQGWLERWECAMLGYEGVAGSVSTNGAAASNEFPEPTVSEDATAKDEPTEALTYKSQSPALMVHPPMIGVTGVFPFGWMPIVISSLMFAVAHIGNGPDPIPLFFFALGLGYVYQRTHRIVPSIVAHALFNSYAMIALWRMVFYDAQ
jgi:membrane protease YdiL (CAAX protease family)